VKKFIEKRRWGLPGGHPPVDHPPLDQILLADAIAYLGKKALADKSSVDGKIGFIGTLHRELRGWDERPIRPADISKNLNYVKESAKEFRSLIAALDYFSLRELHEQGAFRHPSLIAPITDDQSSGDEYEAIREERDSRLLSMLDTIVEASERALDKPHDDLGGWINQPMLGGSANEELVAGCYKLFEKYRPGEATTTAGGDFRTFVSILHELSTGEKNDLERQVKEYLKIKRRNLKGG